MNICVINGSPKGSDSVTLQTVLYLQKKFPSQHFEIFSAARKIKSLERDFTPARQILERSELILFSYPVYTFLAPSQLHRFLQLMARSGVDLEGKFMSQITTSKHFYDMTAHTFLRENCQDMGMKVITGLSADMDDLLTAKGRQQAEEYFRYLLWSVEKNYFEPFPPAREPFCPVPAAVPASGVGKKTGSVVIIADLPQENTQLGSMIARFQRVLPYESTVVNLRDFPFRGGCMGCFRCAATGKCVYTDGFDTFLRERIHRAQAIVYGFSIQEHSMGYRFKLFDDRQFCEGHRTVISGLPVGYLISGDYSREQNLQTVIEGRAQVEGNFFAGVATDREDPDREIDTLAEKLTYGLEHPYIPPKNFYGVGGMKIFRDLVWLMQGLMRLDHKYYKAHGYYDFPQKHRGRMLSMYPVGAMMHSTRLQKKMGGQMNAGILLPYRRVLERTRPEK